MVFSFTYGRSFKVLISIPLDLEALGVYSLKYNLSVLPLCYAALSWWGFSCSFSAGKDALSSHMFSRWAPSPPGPAVLSSSLSVGCVSTLQKRPSQLLGGATGNAPQLTSASVPCRLLCLHPRAQLPQGSAAGYRICRNVTLFNNRRIRLKHVCQRNCV